MIAKNTTFQDHYLPNPMSFADAFLNATHKEKQKDESSIKCKLESKSIKKASAVE
jgi:hypothetical protein